MTARHDTRSLRDVSESAVSTATTVAFLEGPAYDGDGSIYFSDLENDRILKLAADGKRTVFREPSGRTNGNAFDPEGRLVHCESGEFGPGGRRRIARTNLRTGEYEVLTDRYDGVRYNSPNDVCVADDGRIFFTDPRYGDRSDLEMFDEGGRAIEGVYRIDPDGRVMRILAQPDIQRPNGIAVSRDGTRLFVVDSCPIVGGNRKVWRFDLDRTGHPSNPVVMIDFAPGRGGDGIRLDVDGNLYVAAGITLPRGPWETADVPPAIYVVSPSRELVGRIPIREDLLSNLAFGGADGRTLHVTAGKSLFRVRVKIPGQVCHPRWHG